MNYFVENPEVLVPVFGSVIILLYVWLYITENKTGKSKIESVLTWKLPWVKTSEEWRVLEKKSILWYLISIPFRILNFLDWTSTRTLVGGFPVAVIVLGILYLISIIPK